MSVSQRVTLFSVAGALFAAALFVTPTVGTAAGLGAALGPALPYDAAVLGDRGDYQPATAATAEPDPAALDCMAKIVMHEAGHEPRAGQLAVAQTLVNRVNDGRFGASICAVANQPGQFFRTASYNPDRDSDVWAAAVDVSRTVLAGTADPVAPGAIFFHSAAGPKSAFFRSRQHVATIGAQVFYR